MLSTTIARTNVTTLAIALLMVVTLTFPMHRAAADTVSSVSYPAPTLSSASPAAVSSGGTLTLNGSNLNDVRWVFIYNAAGQWVDGFGQSQTGFTNSANRVSFTLDSFTYKYIGGAGTYQADVVTAGGTSNLVTFTVTGSGSTTVSPIAAATPTLTAASPASVPSNGTLTLNGAHLSSVKYVFIYNSLGQWVYGFGQNQTGFTNSASQVSFTLDSFMYKYIGGAGTYQADVVTPGGTSNLVTFTTGKASQTAVSPVAVAAPTLTAASPASVSSNGTLALNGNHLQNVKGVAIYNSLGQWVYGFGQNQTGFTNSASQVSFTLDSFMYKYIGGAGTYQADVFTPGGTSNTVTFTVTNSNQTAVSPVTVAAPTLTAATPASVNAGEMVTLSGANLQNAKWVFFYNAQGKWVDGFGVNSHSFIASANSVSFNVDSSMTNYMGGAGTYQAVVATPGGTSNTVTFTVTDATTGSSSHTPTLTSATPASVNAGGMMTLNGTDLQNAKWVFFYNAQGKWVDGFGVNSHSFIASANSVSFNVDSSMINYMGGAGTYQAAVATPDGTTNLVTFTTDGATKTGVSPISYPAPTLTASTPTSVTSGGTVTLNGSNLNDVRWVFIYNTAGQWVDGFGQAQTGFANSANSLSFTLDSFTYKYIGGDGIYQADVVTAGGTSNLVTFKVNSESEQDSFTASPTYGNAPLTVTFTAANTTSPASNYAINFGDGTASSNWSIAVDGAMAGTMVQTHTYTATGTYTALLYMPPTVPTTCPISDAPCGQHIGTVAVSVGNVVQGPIMYDPGPVTAAVTPTQTMTRAQLLAKLQMLLQQLAQIQAILNASGASTPAPAPTYSAEVTTGSYPEPTQTMSASVVSVNVNAALQQVVSEMNNILSSNLVN